MSGQLAGPAPARVRDPSGADRPGLVSRLFAPIDAASLVFFRVAFGLIMLLEAYRYLSFGWVTRYYVEPEFHFTYYGFGWVRPWGGDWMYVHFVALGALAVFIAVGFLYRVSAVLFFLGFTYVFLLDQSNYLNHFYLISLISFLLIFIPAHRCCSVDAWLRPGLRSRTVPAWTRLLLLAQISIVYFYGGLAKLNGDWLRGEPMRMWLADATDFPVIGRFFTEEWMVYLFSYGGLAFDLLIAPLLIWRRTRAFAFVAAFAFHYTNANLFQIGIFPMFAVAATTLFFSPSWPRRLAGIVRRGRDSASHATAPAGDFGTDRTGPARYAVLFGLALYLAVQLLVPLRHYLYPGNENWTEEGHRFSWHMKLREKEGRAWFVAVDTTTGVHWRIDPRDYMTDEQASNMAGKPDMILQFAHRIAEDMRERGRGNVEVRALTQVSLNGRADQRLIDPNVDLAAEPRTLAPADWIEPLKEPLRGGGK